MSIAYSTPCPLDRGDLPQDLMHHHVNLHAFRFISAAAPAFHNPSDATMDHANRAWEREIPFPSASNSPKVCSEWRVRTLNGRSTLVEWPKMTVIFCSRRNSLQIKYQDRRPRNHEGICIRRRPTSDRPSSATVLTAFWKASWFPSMASTCPGSL